MDEPQGQSAAVRGAQRDRVLARTIVSSAGVQGLQIAVAAVTLPIAARSLSSSEFGVLVILTGVTSLLGFADLGIGSAVTTRVAVARARGDVRDLQESIGTAALMTASCGLAVSVGGIVSAWLVPWQRLLGAADVSESSVRHAIMAVAVGAGAVVAGSLGQRVLFGAQLGHTANRWLASGLAAGAVATVVCAAAGLPLYAYVIAGVAVPGVVALACTVTTMRSVGSIGFVELMKLFRWPTVVAMIGPSFWFFLIGLSGSVAYQTDGFVVANVLGASAAGIYGVAARLFGIVPQIAYPAMLQFWPTAVDALARGDQEWIATRFRRALSLGVAGSVVVCGLLSILAAPVIGAWLGDDLVPPTSLVLALAVWTVYTVLTYPPFAIMNAVGRVRLHAWVAVSVAVLNLPLTIIFTSRVGLEGAVLGSLISNALLAIGPGLWIARKVLTRAL